ncbi:MAG: EamA family transporter [Clostridia bacterium]|nr:EamA family transporter [Clostridia bacterium]
MGYLFLSFALICGAAKGFCGKKISGYADTIKSAVLLNLIRMLLCIAFSFFVILLSSDIGCLSFDINIILISAISGIGTAFFVVSWLLAVRKSAYMMLDVFLMLGTLVPIVTGYLIYSEPVSIRQIVGFALLLMAVLTMCSYNNTVKQKLALGSVFLLICCGITNGIASASQKIYVNTFPETPISIFNLYTYVFASIVLFLFFIFTPGKEHVRFNSDTTKRPFVYICIMAVALSLHSYFSTMAASYLDSVHLYPLSQGSSLVISTLMASIFFKEKLTVKAVSGIVSAFIALLIINL